MRPERGIATDGAHSMKRGVTRYRAVDLATGELPTIFWVSSGYTCRASRDAQETPFLKSIGEMPVFLRKKRHM